MTNGHRHGSMKVMPSVALRCHPSTPSPAVRAVHVRVSRSATGELALAFRAEGDLAQVRVPGPRPPRSGQRLWEHTCFEAFLGPVGEATYHEFNFAPSREWTVYGFRAYRDGGVLADEALAPEIVVRRAGDMLELTAVVRLDRLSALHVHAPLRVGLATVIESNDGTLSYWALHHPSDRPDFHHADAFALRLEPPSFKC